MGWHGSKLKVEGALITNDFGIFQHFVGIPNVHPCPHANAIRISHMSSTARNKSVQDWWPQPEKDSQGLMNVRHVGLFVRGQARRRRVQRVLRAGAKAKAKAKAKAAAKKTSTKKTLKKSKTKKAIPDVVKNFRRNGIGVTLVQQKMEKARILDETKFVENKVFTEDTHQCRLKLPKCNGKLWADVLAKAHPFFVASPLD